MRQKAQCFVLERDEGVDFVIGMDDIINVWDVERSTSTPLGNVLHVAQSVVKLRECER